MEYNNINYISPEVLIAEVKEELKSYFESGGVTDIMLPTYVDQCLRKLKSLVLKPDQAILFIRNYKGELPSDFHKLDYAISYGQRADKRTNIGTLPSTVGYWSKSIECTNCQEDCDPKYEIFEKITCQPHHSVQFVYNSPKWIRVYYGSRDMCTKSCPNLRMKVDDILTIHEHGTLSSTFEEGDVYIRYFSRPVDENGFPLVPEILEVEEYIKSHTKFKIFEQLWNSVVDETFNQIKEKVQYYKQDSLSKLTSALNTLRQRTDQQVNDSIARQRSRFIKYNIR